MWYDTLIQVGLGVLLLIVSLVFGFVYSYLKAKGLATDAVNNAEQLEAEGKEKLVEAINEVVSKLPAVVKLVITKSMIEKMVQSAWEKAEAYAKKQLEKVAKKVDPVITEALESVKKVAGASTVDKAVTKAVDKAEKAIIGAVDSLANK